MTAPRWFMRLRSNYYSSAPLARAGEAAEVLHVRALAWSVAEDTRGFIPNEVLILLTATRARRRVAALKREQLWAAVDGGWQINGFEALVRLDRASIPLGVRLAILQRDGWACVYCGATEPLELDHIYPWSLGGSDDPSNLQTLCRPCNRSKGARVL